MAPVVQYRTFNGYSGPLIQGSVPIQPPNTPLCLTRHHWLTTRVETGALYGAVVMFDGTGITAGPDQFILVFPKELAAEDFHAEDDQGRLCKLLGRLRVVPGLEHDFQLFDQMCATFKITLTPAGEFRYTADGSTVLRDRSVGYKKGALVFGSDLRNIVTPSKGVVPRDGFAWEQAQKWALMMNALFLNPASFRTQEAFGQEVLIRAYKEHKLSNNLSVETVFGHEVSTAVVADVGEEMDLAMACWYSNSVNAPAIAMKCLEKSFASVGGDRKRLPAALIRELGTSSFGRWNSSIPEGRYQRTRKAAIASGMWNLRTITTLMPTGF